MLLALKYLGPSHEHPFVRKVILIFKESLVHACQTGHCDPFLWATSRAVAEDMRCDTEAMEGYNNILKYNIKKAPNITK